LIAVADVFISYARSTSRQAQEVAKALRGAGYSVWRDDQLPAHRSYSEVIEERLSAAKAVVVVWSAEAVRSQWVQSEADKARSAGKLVQIKVDSAPLPMPFDRIQCADLSAWSGEADAPGWSKILASVAELLGGAAIKAEGPVPERSICVLPFSNMSGEPEQEYFSDGISEDVITDLSKVSALFIVARNTAFQFKGKALDVKQVARQLEVSHVLEGSVRKAGGRVRITAQLIDGATGGHVWAERYDRDLTDIFSLQDEISEAIVKALKLKLLPDEKTAIERRVTASAEAYNLYLMARQTYLGGDKGDRRRNEAIHRLCLRATEIDPDYALAWALMAQALSQLGLAAAGGEGDGLAAAERALALDPNLAEAYAARARLLVDRGSTEEAEADAQTALRLDPESYEAQIAMATLRYHQGRFAEAVVHYEKTTALAESDPTSPGMVVSCRMALGDAAGARRAAQVTLERAERVLARDALSGTAMGFGADALLVLGQTERAREWMERALLFDPENWTMRYNFVCALAINAHDLEGALAMLGPCFDDRQLAHGRLRHARIDPDLDPLRDDPRFQAMIAGAEARLAAKDAASG
jgi:adenylate cyclase